LKHERWAILTVVAGTALFGGAMALRHIVDPWWTNAVAAIVTLVLSLACLRDQVRPLLAFRRSAALLAVGLGLVLVLVTHGGFRLAIGMLADLEQNVARLYRDISGATLGVAVRVTLTVLIVAAEELLWRGVAVELCQARLSRVGTAAASTALYALPQLIGGSLVLVVVAAAVGTVFTLQRIVTGRVMDPMITHAIWSVSVFSLTPLSPKRWHVFV